MEKKRNKLGFTIVELLTVMAIIAILMGLLVPALSQVKKLAKDTSQRAQFHSIDVALESFHSEYGMYPESTQTPDSITLSEYTIGAHRLAEALVGRDLLGFDPKSSWNAAHDDGATNSDYKEIYASEDPPQSSSADQVKASVKRRMGPYLNTQSVEAFQIEQLFPSDTGNVYPGNYDDTGTPKSSTYVSAPVLTDVYHAKRVTLPNRSAVMAGTPILYYKANTKSIDFPDTIKATTTTNDDFTSATPTVADANQSGYIYNILDNDELLMLNQMMKPAVAHNFDENYEEDINNDGTDEGGVWIFYNTITNPKITSQARPYNNDTYILISAGHDGIYGTRDDIYNFKQ